MTLRQWLIDNSDDLLATLFMTLMISIGVGLRRRSTGAGIFFAGFTSSIMVVVAYPELTAYGYDWRAGVSVLAPIAGACSWAVFGILVSVANHIEKRSNRIAGKIVDKGEAMIGTKPRGDQHD